MPTTLLLCCWTSMATVLRAAYEHAPFHPQNPLQSLWETRRLHAAVRITVWATRHDVPEHVRYQEEHLRVVQEPVCFVYIAIHWCTRDRVVRLEAGIAAEAHCGMRGQRTCSVALASQQSL